jgi:stress response protein YsnF
LLGWCARHTRRACGAYKEEKTTMKTTALDFMPAGTASAIGCAPSGGAIGEASPPEGTGASRSAAEMQDTATLQLLAEEFSVTKKTVVTGRVRVATRTRNHEAFLDETLARNSVEISAIPMGVFIDAPPQVRMEGDVTIVPVVEEVLFVERRLRLKEELRIRPIRTVEHYREKITLRRQEAIITRDEGDRAVLG